MAALFTHHVDFIAENADALLRAIPAAPGVFSLRGETGEPYITRTADLRRRLRRLLAPPEALDDSGNPVLSKRLNLRDRVRSIDYTHTGSDFESTLLLYHASRLAFGPEQARKRLRLHTPYLVRITITHQHPRAYVTNRLSKKSLIESFGPFPSRAAAERYGDAVLDLFKLRRCYEDLEPYPDHPGCVYGEMNKCLMPCKEGNPAACTPAEYAVEANRVFDFFHTRGQSLLDEIAARRDAASEAMDFETAATHHKQWEKVRSATLLADELVRPLAELRALILQQSVPPADDASHDSAAVFLFANGYLTGPAPLSTLGVRAVREQTAVGSSLFAQPLMLAPVPLDEPSSIQTPEDRARAVIETLTAQTTQQAALDEFCDALSLLRRWYYRPEKQRAGEVFLPNADGGWPIRRILNGAARIVLGPPAEAAPVDREAFKDLKTKVIHAGREGVERVVPVLPRRSKRKPAETLSENEPRA
ncbi:excinuclease ABC subunit C [Granulicella sp. 5B5]|uniref:excinuclease ABC subunit C n=1 Tax=Granulicella sp. 5B5 TaxID=1617967 RepID=UPI0015F3FB10|nr:excinuclease ABC subunit C [Granulicella sp. 5B5]